LKKLLSLQFSIMKRSFSWPQLSSLWEDDDDFLYREVLIEILQQKVSGFQNHNSYSSSQLETLNLEKANLEILNIKLIENSRSLSQQILNLENEKNRLTVQLRKAENLVEVLYQDLKKADREKRDISKDLSIQKQAFQIVDSSKKWVEKQLEMFSEAAARDRNWIESKALEKLGYLTDQLETLGLQLKAKEEAAQHVEIFARENRKLQATNRELINQNVGLERKLKELQVRVVLQEGQNQLLRQEVEDMKLQNALSIPPTLPNQPPTPKISSATASQISTLTLQRDGATPPPVFFYQDFDDKTFVSYRDLEDEQQYDPVDEYIRLSVKVVKIHFPYLSVSSDRLMEIAKTVPFYRAHDVLSSYMRKLDYKQRFREKREKQQPFDINRRSMLEKVRGFFGCGVTLEQVQNNQCNELRRDWEATKNEMGIRVGF